MMKTILLLVSVGAMLVLPAVAGATVIHVDKTPDIYDPGDSGCSLRNAFLSADTDMQHADCETGSGDDVLKLSPGTYLLDRVGANETNGFLGDLDMIDDGDMTIEAASRAGNVVIDGNGTDRIFDHVGPTAGILTLKNIELTNGNPGIGGNGGLIRTASSEVRLDGVTMSLGTGDDGGAVNVQGGALKAVNSTFFGSHAEGSGGAIFSESGSTVDLRSVTITGNEADSDGNAIGDGGGVAFLGNASMTNSILAGNTDLSTNPGDQHNDCASGPSFFPRFVLSTDDLGAGFCLIGFDPGTNKEPLAVSLGSFTDNGGPTWTISIPSDSPAVDAGGSTDPDKCPETDQRGVVRPAGQCDLGAFEFDPDGVPPDRLPGIAKPTLTTAVFDGSKLKVLVKCPARFKPKCSSKVQARKSKNGAAISSAASLKIKSGKTGTATLVVKPDFQAMVDGMTFLDQRKLAVSNQIRSAKVGKRKAKRPTRLNLSLKVRFKN